MSLRIQKSVRRYTVRMNLCRDLIKLVQGYLQETTESLHRFVGEYLLPHPYYPGSSHIRLRVSDIPYVALSVQENPGAWRTYLDQRHETLLDLFVSLSQVKRLPNWTYFWNRPKDGDVHVSRLVLKEHFGAKYIPELGILICETECSQ